MAPVSRIGGRALAALLPDVRTLPGPVYSALGDAITALVLDGRIATETRLPSERELASALRLSRATVTAAYDALRTGGYLASRTGSGSYVSVPAGSRPRQSLARWATSSTQVDDIIDLSCGALPAPAGVLGPAIAAATAQLGPIAKDYGLARIPMSFFGTMLPLLTMTLAIDNLANGFTRPLCGFLSDRFGRENTMMVVFIGEGLALLGLMKFGHQPVAFMTFAALIFLCWGELFSIFPALVADTFGVKNAAANAGTMYTAKGTAALLVPLGSILSAGGNWDRVFIFTAAITITAGILSKVALAPMRRRRIAEVNADPSKI